MRPVARDRLGVGAFRVWRFLAAHPAVLVGGLLTVLGLVLAYPAVLGGQVLAPEDALLFSSPLSATRTPALLHASNYLLGDAVQVFHPDFEWARAAVRSGHLPLWDPDVFAGWPVFASQQTALLYPLNMIAYVLPLWPALGLIFVLKVVLAGLGTWWLCRRLRLGAPASLLAAIAYGLGAYFVIWLEHPHTNIYALIPALLAAIDLVCERRRLADGALLAGIVGLCLIGGQPESAFIAMLAAVPFALVRLAGLEDQRARRRGLALLSGAVALGAAAGAVMLVPFAQLASQAPDLARGGGDGLPGHALLSLLLPDLWGRPESGFEVPSGPVNYAERTFYVGALPLMLAAAGLYRLRDRDRDHRFFVGLLIGSLIISVHVPAVTAAIVGLPGMSEIALDRALILVALSLAVLSGYGLERLLAADPAERRAMLRLAAAVACVPVVWLSQHLALLPEIPRFSDIAPSLWGASGTAEEAGAAAFTRWVVFAVAGLVVLRLAGGAGRRGRTTAVAIVVALAAGDLLALNHGYHPAVPQARATPAPTPSLVAARAAQGSGRTIGYREYLIPNVASRYGLRDPRGHGLPALGRYLALWNGLGEFGFQATRLRRADVLTGRALDEFAVTQLLTAHNEPPPAAPGLRLASSDPDGDVYTNVQALPRAYVATDWRPAASRAEALAATLASRAAQLRAAPVIEGSEPVPASSSIVVPDLGGASGQAAVTDDEDAKVTLSVDAPSAGYLVLLDTYYAGWSATVDGHPAKIHPANEAFRAVAVPAGHHRVVFRYRPTVVLAAGALSGLAWLAIVGLIAAPRLRSRRTRARTPRRVPRERPRPRSPAADWGEG
ncbi:MAG: YfhO family protein [Solirubrobacteraceae bacterium]